MQKKTLSLHFFLERNAISKELKTTEFVGKLSNSFSNEVSFEFWVIFQPDSLNFAKYD